MKGTYLNHFKARLVKTRKNSSVFFNSFLKSSLSINFYKFEKYNLLFKKADKKLVNITSKRAIEQGKFIISFNHIEHNFKTDEYKTAFNFSNELKTLIKKNKVCQEEKNMDALYLGYPFLEGMLDDNPVNTFRAPLFLWKINIYSSKNNTFNVEIEKEPVINNSLLSSIASTIGNAYEYIEYDEIDESIQNDKIQLVNYLMQKAKLELKPNWENEVNEAFNFNFTSAFDFTKPAYFDHFIANNINPSYSATVTSLCAIGLFDFSSSALLSAYKTIESEQDIDFLEQILESQIDFLNNKQDDIVDEKIITVSKLDESQKIAIKNSLHQSMLIWGPPGTGKSETIVNLIINLIAQRKKTLFITEKQVASDVVYNRLNKFQTFVLRFYSQNTSKRMFQIVKNIYQVIIEANNNGIDLTSEKIIDQIEAYWNNIKTYRQLMQSNAGKVYYNFLKQYSLESIQKLTVEKYEQNAFHLNNDNYQLILDFINTFKNDQAIFKVIDFLKIFDHDKHLDYFLKKMYENQQSAMYATFNLLTKKKYKLSLKFFDKKKYQTFLLTELGGNVKLMWKYIHKNYNENQFELIIKFIKNKFYDFIDFEENAFANFKNLLFTYGFWFEQANKSILNFAIQNWTEQLQKLYQTKNKIDNDLVYNQYLNHILHVIKTGYYNTFENNQSKPLAKLFNELGSRLNNVKTHLHIKTYFKHYQPLMDLFFPIIISNPEDTANGKLIPLKRKEFSHAIFDEASQIFIENAVPAMYRSCNYIISGDDMQLPPNDFFTNTSAYDEDLEYEAQSEKGLDLARMVNYKSLLDFAKEKYNQTMLQYHYRSKYSQLINFSNQKFYDNKLFIVNNPQLTSKPIEVIEVEGQWNNNRNIVEAEKIVELVKTLIKNPAYQSKSIGIITFNQVQCDLITNLLEENSENDKTLFEKLNSVKDDQLFIKNIENVQGDERDIIIFSVGYGKSATGKFINNFGPISKQQGEKRLNVAITRAREKIYLVKSIASSLINAQTYSGNFFKQYLQYAELLQQENENQQQVELLLAKDNLNSKPYDNNMDNTAFDSYFEIEVFNELQKIIDQEKYVIHNKVKTSGYFIDLAILDKTKNEYVLAIECDGAIYHSKETDRQRDYERQTYLESRGWKFKRIFSTVWWERNGKGKKQFLNDITSYLLNLEKNKISI